MTYTIKASFRPIHIMYVVFILLALNLSITPYTQAANKKSVSHRYQASYVVIFSDDTKACNYIVKMFNSDLQKFGHIKPDNHDEFKSIKWTKIAKKIKHPGFVGLQKKYTFLDIDKNFTKELLVKETGNLGGLPSDNIYIYKISITNSVSIDRHIDTESLIAKFAYTGSSYSLRGIPPFTYKLGQFSGRKSFYKIGGIFAIHPFMFEDNVFFSINERVSNNIPGTIDMTDWHLVVAYDSSVGLKDICYFKKKRNKSKVQNKR